MKTKTVINNTENLVCLNTRSISRLVSTETSKVLTQDWCVCPKPNMIDLDTRDDGSNTKGS